MSDQESYRDKVMDYYISPRNKRWFEGADIDSHGSNPACGDDVSIQARLDGDVIEDIAFSGRGCAISQAAASMLTELAKGKRLEWVERSSDEDIFKQLGLGEHRKARASCELLGIRALRNAVFKYRSRRNQNAT